MSVEGMRESGATLPNRKLAHDWLKRGAGGRAGVGESESAFLVGGILGLVVAGQDAAELEACGGP